ncbi:MAG: PQQ-binding-like beta-propeller repeat protein [Streptosporangiaceae bacterium]
MKRLRWVIKLRPEAALAMLAVGLAVVGCGSGAQQPSQATGSPVPVPTAATSASGGSAQATTSADWLTYDRTAQRDGVSVSSPSPGVIRRAWTAHVDGAVYAQPLIVGSEVIIATENDTVYALNATTGAVRWSRHLATPVPSGLPCGNILPSGITGTPVADPASGHLWLVTFTSRPAYRHTLWELDLSTGATVWQRTADVAGSDVMAQQQRGALLLLGSRVYVPFGGLYGDCSDYKGRIVGASVSGDGPMVTFTTDNQRQAGIWAPAGESYRDGSLYATTGNGTPYDQVDDSDSVLQLSPELKVEGIFTPSNFVALSADDQDLGSTEPALLPDGLIFQVGKQGMGYLLNGSRLGGTGGQLASARVCEGGFGGDAVDGDLVVFSCYDSLHVMMVTGGAKPAMRAGWSVSGGNPGPPVIAGGVVWDVSRNGELYGYRLSNGARMFSAATAPVGTDFPSLSVSGTRMIVPEGVTVVSYTGV